VIDGQVRHIGWLKWAQARDGRLIVVARNNDKLQILRPLRYRPPPERSTSSTK